MQIFLVKQSQKYVIPSHNLRKRIFFWQLCTQAKIVKLVWGSGVLLNMEVGICKRAWHTCIRYTLLIYDHWGEYTLSKKPGGWCKAYTPQYTTGLRYFEIICVIWHSHFWTLCCEMVMYTVGVYLLHDIHWLFHHKCHSSCCTSNIQVPQHCCYCCK